MKVRYVRFSADEWIAGTVSLSAVERGVYITACALIYSHGGPIKISNLQRVSGCHGNSFRSAFDRLVELGKLIRNGDEITSKRCQFELEMASKRTSKARENASKPTPEYRHTKGLQEADASALREANHKLRTINHELEESPHKPPKGHRSDEPETFAVWWQEYPHKVGRAAALLKYRAALAAASPAELLSGLQRYVASKPPDRPWCNPATWLNQQRWLDQPQEIHISNGQEYDPRDRLPKQDSPRNPPSQALLQRLGLA